ncbi:MAG: acyl carrier protein [Acidobacteriota bacterium]
MSVSRARVLSVIAAVLKISPAELDDASSPDSIDSWDSLHHLQILLALEEEFARQFPAEDVDRLQSVGAILTTLDAGTP